MSLLRMPRPSFPDTFNVLEDISPAEVHALTGIRADESPNMHFELPVPAEDFVQRANFAAIEQRIADLLQTSRVPGASGTRLVFVDLPRGNLIVGTTVWFNAQRKRHAVVDASLEHKVAFISSMLELLYDTSHTPAKIPELSLVVNGEHVDLTPLIQGLS